MNCVFYAIIPQRKLTPRKKRLVLIFAGGRAKQHFIDVLDWLSWLVMGYSLNR